MLILVLEASTSSAKAMLYSQKGVLKVESVNYPADISDVKTQDADAVFSLMMQVGRRVLDGQATPDFIVLSGAWHGVMALDSSYKPLTRVHSWPDRSASVLTKELSKDKPFSSRFYQETGCVVHSTYPLFKIIHFGHKGIDLNNSIFMGQGTYNFYRMTGKHYCSESMASGSGFMRIRDKTLSEEALDYAKITKWQLGNWTDYRHTEPLTEEAARLLGCKGGIPILTAQPDGSLNQVSAGALQKGVMTLSVGTSGALRISTEKPVLPSKPSTWCYLSPTGWLSGAATSGACNCSDWFKDAFFPPEVSYREIESTPFSHADLPIFLPFLYGERCPGWIDTRQGVFHDLKPQHQNTDLYYSVLEGVLFNLYQCYELIVDINGEPDIIKLSGGILNSVVWTQMCSDIFGKEIECSDQKEMSLIGGAVLGLELAGELDSVLDFEAAPGFVIEPNLQRQTMYRKRYDRYMQLYTEDTFDTLSEAPAYTQNL